MKQRIIGYYNIGDETVQLVLREGTGGEFYFQPGDIKCARIKIGASHTQWHQIVSVLMHESLELVLARMALRYYPEEDWGRDMGSFLFVMRHEQFSDACARSALLISECSDDLKRAWKHWQKQEGHGHAHKRVGIRK